MSKIHLVKDGTLYDAACQRMVYQQRNYETVSRERFLEILEDQPEILCSKCKAKF